MMARVIKTALFVSVLVVLAAACREHRAGDGTGTSGTTQTVAPAAAQPAPTGTDAMTQTVDVEAGRSEEDGGVTASTATVKTETAAKPAAPKKPAKKH